MIRVWLSFALCLFVLPLQAAENVPPAAPPTEAPAKPVMTPPRAANAHTIGQYPELSRANREEGIVTVRFTVNTDGTVSNASLLRSSGFPRLDQAALDEVTANWRYHPAMRDGVPITVTTAANVNFKLNEPAGSVFKTFHMEAKDFPPGARAAGMRGTTLLLVFLDENNAIVRIGVTQTSGYDELDKAAQDIVRGWTFKAALVNGKPTASGLGFALEWPPG